MKQTLELCYIKFVAPRSKDEDSKRQEFILNVILLGSFFLLFSYGFFILKNSIRDGAAYGGVPFWLYSLIPLSFFGLYLLSRVGFTKIASHLVTAIYYVSTTWGVYTWGADLQTAILAYVLIISISSILISTRYGFIVTGIISIVMYVIWHYQIHGVIIADWDWRDRQIPSRVIQFIIMYFVIMIIAWLSNREIEKSLTRARSSEKTLREERDQLEIKVEERTKDLKQAQAEKMNQLYRFAEFGRLSSGLFHDLMSPLTSLTLQVNEITAKQTDLAETPQIIEKAVKASKRMEQFMCTVERQINTEDAIQTFSVNDEVDNVLEILSYRSKRANVPLQFHADEDVIISGHPLQFQQIILNVISNAIESYPTHSGSVPSRTVGVTLQKTDRFVTITIEDNGSGISLKNQENLFNPFFTTKGPRRMGLGLFTTKSILTNYFRGTIEYTHKQVGSIGIIKIPIL